MGHPVYILQIDEQVQKAFQLWQDVSDLRLIFLQSFNNHRQKKTAVNIVKRKHIMNHNKNYNNNNINNNENKTIGIIMMIFTKQLYENIQ